METPEDTTLLTKIQEIIGNRAKVEIRREDCIDVTPSEHWEDFSHFTSHIAYLKDDRWKDLSIPTDTYVDFFRWWITSKEDHEFLAMMKKLSPTVTDTQTMKRSPEAEVLADRLQSMLDNRAEVKIDEDDSIYIQPTKPWENASAMTSRLSHLKDDRWADIGDKRLTFFRWWIIGDDDLRFLFAMRALNPNVGVLQTRDDLGDR